MKEKLEWNKLLSEDREVGKHREERTKSDKRNEFDNDYDRIAFSSSLRRLQDKAQVFPLEKHDFVRTRLTHSLEVSTLAKSLGLSVGELIKENRLEENFDDKTIFKISSILASAGLIHDIGNPPFGHFGETAIRDWFKEHLNSLNYKGKKISYYLDNQLIKDFENFEGNAQALRVLTKLHFLIDEHGMNLSYAVLNSIIKYPRNSTEINKHKGISYKKMGYFYSEEEIFNKVTEATGTKGIRHPLTFLLEAADDIAYKSADIEDGYKKGKINYEILMDEFSSIDKPTDIESKLINSLREYYTEAKNMNYYNPGMYAVQRFRVIVQGFMMSSVTDAFIKNYNEIMTGTFEQELLEVSSANRISDILKNMARKYIFKAKDILILEVEGHKIITKLLDSFIDAVLSDKYSDCTTKEGKLYNLISDNYRFINEKFGKENDDSEYIYNRLLLVCDFICGMTDSYAKELYQSLSGISF